LDFATLQLQLGYVEFGQREVRVIETACQTVLRFLPDIEDAEARAKFTDDIEQVSASLENLKRKLLSLPLRKSDRFRYVALSECSLLHKKPHKENNLARSYRTQMVEEWLYQRIG